MPTEWIHRCERRPCCDDDEGKSVCGPREREATELSPCPGWFTLMCKAPLSFSRTQFRKETEGILKASATKL